SADFVLQGSFSPLTAQQRVKDITPAPQSTSVQSPLPVVGSTDPAPGPPDQPSGDRVALVIGNSKYPDADEPLKTPVNDALVMSKGLAQVQFTVVSGVNLSASGMRQKLDLFYGSVTPGSIAIVFFGGYAIQSNRQNYLIPVDAQIWSEADVRHDGVDLEIIL